MRDPEPHPYAEIFPLCSGSSLIELSDSIAVHGQHEDIVLYEKKVLDGRRRLAACVRAGVKPRFRQFGSRIGDGEDALQFAFDLNFNRRNMTDPERTIAAVAFATLRKGIHANGPNGPSGASQSEASAKFGVPVRNMKRAKAVLEKAVDEVKAAYKEEKVSLSDAASIVNEPPAVQRKAVAAVVSGAAPTLKAAVAGTKPAAGTDRAKLVRDLDSIVQRVPGIVTENVAGRDLLLTGLRAALALVRTL